MEYEIYKSKLKKDDYFKKWDSKNFNNLTESLKADIYERYLVKCDVFTRDNFTCQNTTCLRNNTPITMHHIRFQKNDGPDSQRNCITLCKTCHMAFHRAEICLTFPNIPTLPPHIRGCTFKYDKTSKVNWKRIVHEMKTMRRRLRVKCNYSLTYDQVRLLMQFLKLVEEDQCST